MRKALTALVVVISLAVLTGSAAWAGRVARSVRLRVAPFGVLMLPVYPGSWQPSQAIPRIPGTPCYHVISGCPQAQVEAAGSIAAVARWYERAFVAQGWEFNGHGYGPTWQFLPFQKNGQCASLVIFVALMPSGQAATRVVYEANVFLPTTSQPNQPSLVSFRGTVAGITKGHLHLTVREPAKGPGTRSLEIPLPPGHWVSADHWQSTRDTLDLFLGETLTYTPAQHGLATVARQLGETLVGAPPQYALEPVTSEFEGTVVGIRGEEVTFRVSARQQGVEHPVPASGRIALRMAPYSWQGVDDSEDLYHCRSHAIALGDLRYVDWFGAHNAPILWSTSLAELPPRSHIVWASSSSTNNFGAVGWLQSMVGNALVRLGGTVGSPGNVTIPAPTTSGCAGILSGT